MRTAAGNWEVAGNCWEFPGFSPGEIHSSVLRAHCGETWELRCGRVNMSRSSAQKEVANWYGLSLDSPH